MSPVRLARVVVLLGAGLLAAGCASRPLPEARSRLGATPARAAWDSQACAWEAQNASGYLVDLSPDENSIYNLFAYGRPRGATAGSDPLLGRGGMQRFDQVFAGCMNARGYDS